MAPKIIFGTASFGMDLTGFQDAESVRALLKTLQDLNIRHLDSGARYPPLSPGRAEQLIGEAKELGAGFVVDTKVYTDTRTDGSGDLTPAAIEKSCRASLQRLQRPEGVSPVQSSPFCLLLCTTFAPSEAHIMITCQTPGECALCASSRSRNAAGAADPRLQRADRAGPLQIGELTAPLFSILLPGRVQLDIARHGDTTASDTAGPRDRFQRLPVRYNHLVINIPSFPPLILPITHAHTHTHTETCCWGPVVG